MTLNCFEQLNPLQRIIQIFKEVSGIQNPVATTVGVVNASGSFSIPAGAKSWSVFVSGANASIKGQAVPTGTVLSGRGPLDSALALVTGATTTIHYAYSMEA